MDLYAEVTDRIIAELENGIIPWERPWTGVRTGAISRATGKPYSLLNQMILGKPGEYITFKQCKDEGGKVKKGSKAKIVVFWKFLQKEKTDTGGRPLRGEDGQLLTESIPFLRYFSVFHISDCEDIKPKYNDEQPVLDIQPDQTAENTISDYVQRSGVTLAHEKQNQAYYRPKKDMIVMPLREQFLDTPKYYGTLFHEVVHSTGHFSRLNRFEAGASPAAFGSADYSKEELVAEIGSSVILNEIRIETPSSFRNNVAYIQNWLRVLKNDKKFIVSAASRAEKAVNLILDIQTVRPEGG